MKLNQLLLLAGLSLSAFTFSSCDKEDIMPATPGAPPTGTPSPSQPTPPPATPTTPPITTNSLLQQLGTKTLTYDTQNRLVDVSYTDQPTLGYTVVYEGAKPVRLNFKGSSNFLLYTYEGDQVVEAVRYDGENQVNYRYNFEYSGDKLVKKTTRSYAQTDEGKLGIAEYRYDANGNLTELVQNWSSGNSMEGMGSPFVIRYGDYDGKPNPMPYAESEVYLPGVKLFENNPGFRDHELYSYTYHASGMPKQRHTKLKSNPYVQDFIETYIYR